MKALVLAAGIFVAGAGSAAACPPLTWVDRDTGRTMSSHTDEAYAWLQEGWRARSESWFLARVTKVELLEPELDLRLTLSPVTTLEGGPLPDQNLEIAQGPCSDPELEIGDLAVVWADEANGAWTVVGIAALDTLQRRPANYPDLVRRAHRGLP